MATSNEQEACLRLAKALSEQPPDNAQLLDHHSAAVSKLRTADLGQATSADMVDALRDLTMYFYATTDEASPYSPKLTLLLADITREEPFWRLLFGLPVRPSPDTNLRQLSSGAEPDCILEVARRIINRSYDPSKGDEEQAALRLIANCCADNNINRSIIVHRGGVESLMAMVARGEMYDLTLPTLYNVCVDYDEPAVDSEGRPLPPLDPMQPGTDQSVPTLNLAEQKLGMYHDSVTECSFAMLSTARSEAGMHLSALADLIEMASRVVLSAKHYLPTSASNDNHPEQTSKQAVDFTSLIQPLILEGSEIINEEPELCAPICQAVLNILSRRKFRDAIATNDDLIWRLINLPYPPQNHSDEDDEKEFVESLAQYRKAILKIVYEISASDTYSAISGPNSTLLNRCMALLKGYSRDHLSHPDSSEDEPDFLHPGPLASVCVLVANSITATDRAVHYATGIVLASYLSTIVECSFDPDVLLPAVDIATRLALCNEGQNALHMVPFIGHLPKNFKPTSGTNALAIDIQRATVDLLRLLIKGRPTLLSDLSTPALDDPGEDQTVMASVLSLFETTNDVRTIIDIGRLSIEMLRTYFCGIRPRPGAQWEAGPGNPMNEHDFLLQCRSPDPNNTLTIADTIAYMITQPQVQSQGHDPSSAPTPGTGTVQAEAEAWFGLALLSTLLADARPWIINALARNENQLLVHLRQFAHENSSKKAEGPSAKGETNTDPETTHDLSSVGRDPRYENIKVLIVRMMQTQVSDTNSTDAVSAGIRAAAAEMGLDGISIDDLRSKH
ncbi:hypothetical protein PV11_02449 [Exophiala sideris]|uniref:Uncharacterized protein n=1 Tax=Exophiala sideris TaxID=1016849 RepID=A0A0D1ZJ76_9EURO|nr:hypothetical protein PV11_02449 [Exophiala sideris]